MTLAFAPRRLAAAVAVFVLTVLLAACFILPGKFAETLDLRRDGHFTYTYKGEILVVGLSKLAELGGMNAPASAATFEPAPCLNENTDEERACTKAELTEQKVEWDSDQKSQQEAEQVSKKQQNESMKAALGGIDPNDPKAGEELAARLRKQAGWNSVIYKGDGLYQVDFAISGQLSYDLSVPTMERIRTVLPFITMTRRADGSVRIDSPLFEGNGNSGGMGAMAGGQMAAAGAGAGPDLKGLPEIDGTLTLTTDGGILANNTDEGPATDPRGQRLVWKINPRNTAAPMALIQLAK